MQNVIWAEKAVGSVVLALIKRFELAPGDVVGKKFVAANVKITYSRLAEILTKGTVPS